ncbi:proteoglycan 4 isoform X2 [Planococcus citri]|uniref:proteoglycan 4 isoform X2 n=1 Tax=Planococcus citri TaxID=170843 RepID=UPI0031F97E39
MAKRIHVRDLAPFASSEDLSDERESPLDEEKQKAKLPQIEEEMKESSKVNLNVINVAPRIDISRASSSSHQEDSSPERELLLGADGKGSKLEVAFGEENASDLHSSTEELSFQDPAEAEKYKKKKQSQTFTDLQNENQRKDSGCSDIALLSISGRTSRVSSVGSVASGGSGISNYSARSHLSATSNLSRASRGSSPHRMSLETSFCGPKPMHSVSIDVDETVKSIADKLSQKTEMAENAAAAAAVATAAKEVKSEKATTTTTKTKRTPREPVRKAVADSKASASSQSQSQSRDSSSNRRRKPSVENPKTQKFVSLHSDEEEEPIASKSVNAKSKPTNPTNPAVVDSRTQIFIPLHGDGSEVEKTCEPNPNSPKRLKPFTNTTLVNFISRYDTAAKARRERRSTVSESKADYNPRGSINEEFQKFIRLKDDDDDYGAGSGSGSASLRTKSATPPKHRRSVSNIPATTSSTPTKPAASSAKQIVVPIQVYQAPDTTSPSADVSAVTTTTTAPSLSSAPPAASTTTVEKPISDLPKYLMTNDGTTQYIPLRGSDSDLPNTRQQSYSNQNYLSVNKNDIKSLSDDRNLSHLSPLISPNLGRHKPSNLELNYRDHPTRSAKSMTQLINRDESRTPSPNASASNHTRLYRRCSESAKEIRNIEKSKSRSGSIKSLFSSFFKRSNSARNKKTHRTVESNRNEIPDSKITNVEFTFKQQAKSKEPDSIIIPLHSDDESAPSNSKGYGERPKRELKQEKPQSAENKTNITDKIVTKSIPSASSSPKIKSVSYANNIEGSTTTTTKPAPTSAPAAYTSRPNEPQKVRVEEYTCCKKEIVREIRIVEKTSISSSPEVEKRTEIYKLECEVTVHNEESRQPDIEKQVKKNKLEPVAVATATTAAQVEEKESPLTDHSDSNVLVKSVSDTRVDPAEKRKKMSKHEAVDGEEGDISTDSDRVTLMLGENEEEHKTLVNTSESFDEELPYVPTTLPQERSVAVPIVPIKERLGEIRMQSVDRPRSVTPLNPALLDNYVATSLPATVTSTDETSTTEKLHITLPRCCNRRAEKEESPNKKKDLAKLDPT